MVGDCRERGLESDVRYTGVRDVRGRRRGCVVWWERREGIEGEGGGRMWLACSGVSNSVIVDA